jgi:hypothetical protein
VASVRSTAIGVRLVPDRSRGAQAAPTNPGRFCHCPGAVRGGAEAAAVPPDGITRQGASLGAPFGDF